MIFNDFIFILIFSLFLLIYWNLNQDSKKYALLVFNIFFILAYGASTLAFVFASTLINYILIKNNYLKTAVGFNLLALISFKFIIPHSFLITIGFSYYTFNLISYIVDIQRGLIKPYISFLDNIIYVSFFPGFLAGPLNRAKNFFSDLQEIKLPDSDKFISLFLLFLWGYFKKSYCGDWINIYYTSQVFGHLDQYHSLTVLSAIIFYVLEIYFDFSGYSLMAKATAGFLGFDVPHNFNYPFLAKSMTEFWNRWHITLSLWLRDYLYYPIRLKMQGFSAEVVIIVSTMLTWIAAGVWHGKGWVFFYYGLIQGLYITIHQLWKHWENKRLKRLNIKRVQKDSSFFGSLSMLTTFLLFSYSMILFRSTTLEEYFAINRALAQQFNSNLTQFFPFHLWVFIFVVVGEHAWGLKNWTTKCNNNKPWIKGLAAGLLILYIFLVAPKNFIQFIYFKY